MITTEKCIDYIADPAPAADSSSAGSGSAPTATAPLPPVVGAATDPGIEDAADSAAAEIAERRAGAVVVEQQVADFIGSLDKRTRRARAYQQMLDALIADAGGPEAITAARLELMRRASALAVLSADTDRAIIEGRPVDLLATCMLANTQGRALARLGLDRSRRSGSYDWRSNVNFVGGDEKIL